MPEGIGRPTRKPYRDLYKSTVELENKYGKDDLSRDTRKLIVDRGDAGLNRRHDLKVLEQQEAGLKGIMNDLDKVRAKTRADRGKTTGGVDYKGGSKGLKWFGGKD